MTEEPPSRILLLLRHGKAESFAEHDHARALTEKGEAQARLVGDYLRSQAVIPGQVLVSSARRTQETWEGVRAALGSVDCTVSVLDSLYSGGVSETLGEIATLDPAIKVALVVAHEPTMSQLAATLADDESSDSAALAQVRIGVPTGSMSVLTSSAPTWELEAGSLTLHTLVRS